MPKLRLTLLIGSFTVGGAQQVVYELIRKLDKSVVSINVICYEGRVNTHNEAEIEKLCNVVFLNEKGKITLRKMRKVFSALKETKPDIVHAHLGGMAYAVPWTLLSKTPLLITAHAEPSQSFIPAVLPLIQWGLNTKRIRIAAISRENSLMLQNYFSINDERITYVNDGIDLGKFYRKQHDSFTYINVARQDENKNQAQILRCFKKIHETHPDTRLILVGDGPCHEKLIELSEGLGLEQVVEFPGMVSDVETYYAVSDVYVQASYREALSMSILEAMASGLVLLSTNVGGVKDIVVHNENGIMVPVQNDDAMCKAMEDMYNLSAEAKIRMLEYSKKCVQEYSSEAMAQGYTRLYLEMRK